VQFADGVNALIAYNKSIVNDPYSNEVVKVTGTDQKSVGLDTQALSILYDVSGAKTPNSYGTGKDIRGLNIALQTGADIVIIGTSYSAVDCSDSSGEDYKYCGSKPSGYTSDYWAGANKTCATLGMKLPELGSYDESELYCSTNSAEKTLCGIYNNREEYSISSGWFFSETETPSKEGAYVMVADTGTVYFYYKNEQGNVACVK
ncbi:hypothetical protein IJZ97_05520, partial [bacterium]|nr:hypothetical protein [bacterium]